MKRLMTILLTTGALCAAATDGLAKPLRVVATSPELGALVSAIGGEHVRVKTITTGREDPHFLQARPTFMVMARDAELWVRMGMDLEVGWEPVLLDGARNPSIRVGQPRHFDGGAYIAHALNVPEPTATRAMGDVHPAGNPHYMLDPLNARQVAKALGGRLGEVDPANRDAYTEALDAFVQRLDKAVFGAALVGKLGGERLWQAEAEGTLDALLKTSAAADLLGGWMAVMRPWKDKPVITFHKSWEYLAHRFGFRIAAHLEPLPGVPPTPGHLVEVVATAKAENVELILKEPFYPERPARFVADQSPAQVRTVSSYATDASADGYFTWMDSVIAVFKQ